MTLPKFEEKYTVDDYMRWQGDWELIEGVPYAMAPSPRGRHQLVCLLISTQIEEKLRTCEEKCFVLP